MGMLALAMVTRRMQLLMLRELLKLQLMPLLGDERRLIGRLGS